MKKSLLRTSVCMAALFLIGINGSFAQSRIVFGSAATYMRLNGGTSGTPIYLVIDNSAANAITHSGTGGMISEGEFNYVKWNIGNTTGTAYNIPWRDETSPATEDISVRFNITSAGNAGGFFLASTWDGTWDNNTYKPTTGPAVANVLNASGANNSHKIVDRFWGLIDETSYSTTKPTLANLRFYYPDNEWNVASNSITEANLQAQRWNNGTSPNGWQGLLFGTGNTASNYVEVAALASADLFRWWTLTDLDSPLPVEWLYVNASCEGGNVIVKWGTATEQNSSHFTVERSVDGVNYSYVASVQAAGNSSTVKNYHAVDADPFSGTAFYRIKQTDFDGSFSYSSIVSVNGCTGDDVIIYGGGDGAVISIFAAEEGQYRIEAYNALGQIITQKTAQVEKGTNILQLPLDVASGIYFVKAFNEHKSITRKIVVRSNK